MSNHSLLLRLFNSEFFNSWFAVSYLHKYPENIGIQHYLCDRLKEFTNKEIQFFLPQLCHFLITRPSSVAVELFLIDLCHKSNHFAILTYWYFHAYNSDIGEQTLHPGYKVCRRMLKKCQKILFQEQNSLSTNTKGKQIIKKEVMDSEVEKIKENISPALMGMASMMLGFASPVLARVPAKMALAEGSRIKVHNLGQNIDTKTQRSNNNLSKVSEKLHVETRSSIRRKSADNEDGNANQIGYKYLGSRTDPPSPDDVDLDLNSIVSFSSPSLEELRNGQAFSLMRYVNRNSNHSPSVPDRILRKSHRLSLGSGDLSKFGAAEDSNAESEAEDFGYTCESDSEGSEYTPIRRPSKELLNSHYFHSEIQFVLSLMSISNRLCLVPKTSRQGSLQAELALLNHNLPADICIPLWCSATSGNSFHHKVVRISPKDSVVLNSADRVPYLIFIEVLEDEKGVEIEKSEEQKEPVGIPDSYGYRGRLPDAFSGDVSLNSNSQQNQIYFQSVLSRRSSNAQDEYSESMRTAAVMLAQLTLDKNGPTSKVSTSAKANNYKADPKELIREKIITEMAALEANRMDKMKYQGINSGIGGSGGEGNGGELLVDEKELMKTVYNKDDPSAAVFKEDWESKENRIRNASPFGDRNNWKLLPLIVKTGADLRQEQFALQLIKEMERIWKDAGLNIWVHVFNIMVTSNDNGFIEMVKNTISVHSLKKDAYSRGFNTKGVIYSLYDHFVREFGDPSSSKFLAAQDNFMRSLVGYSLITYILQLRDRHNGNILVDIHGNLVHIDFGFMLSNSPGSVGFELAPFKMTQEYLDILGGVNSIKFTEFKVLMKKGFLALRKYADNIILLVEMMQKDTKLPCFAAGPVTIINLKERFHLNLSESAVEDLVDRLILSSSCNVFTRLYDTFQYYSNSIL